MFGPECDANEMLGFKSQLDHFNIWTLLPNIREPKVIELFQAYWTTAHICFPILDEATIRNLYETLPLNDQLSVDRHSCVLAAIILSVLALAALYRGNQDEAEYYHWWACCMAKLDAGKYELEMVIVNVLKASDLSNYGSESDLQACFCSHFSAPGRVYT